MVSNNNQTTMPAEPVSLSLETLQEAPGAWEHGEEYDPNAESRLTLAKATRDQAESARQKIAEEILEATREKCQKLIISGNNALQHAKHLESEADTWHSEAQAELKQAETFRAEAEANRNSAQQSAMRLETEAEAKYAEAEAELKRAESNRVQAEADRERILADSHRAARAVLDEARMESDRDRMESERVCLDLKRQASVEAQGILAQARTTREELEAQRIYADAARLKAWSQDILMQVEEQPAEAPVSSKPSTNGNTASPEPANGAKSAVPAQAARVETARSGSPSKQAKPRSSGNAKKPANGAKSAVLAQAAIVETAPSEMPSKQDQPKNSGNAKRPARRAKAAK
ncbi:MAG: hypothetical protein QF714_09840 [Dehalococcoidia bacterium]|nr:hypothetical protein [Dehalococcoidia bacterium]